MLLHLPARDEIRAATKRDHLKAAASLTEQDPAPSTQCRGPIAQAPGAAAQEPEPQCVCRSCPQVTGLQKSGNARPRIYGTCRKFAGSPYTYWAPTIRSERAHRGIAAARLPGRGGPGRL